MSKAYEHLGEFSDLAALCERDPHRWPEALPGLQTQRRLLDALNFSSDSAVDLRIEGRWQRDGIDGTRLSWSVGYGPRTTGWLLRPLGVGWPLPGILALHDHGGFKVAGIEKIADGPDPVEPHVQRLRDELYGGVSFANELAKRGFAVLAHDVFLWGSRRFAWETMPPDIREMATKLHAAGMGERADPPEVARYHLAATLHEHLVEKYCRLMGTSLAGVISHEDRVAAGVLEQLDGVRRGGIGCVGLSGGGLRSALLQGTCDRIRAAVVVGMMTTYGGLLDHNVFSHTWMLYPEAWARHGDWPDIAACRAPSPLMVQYDRDDALFTLAGMEAAHAKLTSRYAGVGAAEAYVGRFYDGPHKFDRAMQVDAFDWLAAQFAE
jgi:dienelactone hydrolase